MQMFAIDHGDFNYVTTDKELVMARVYQGYAVRAISFIRQSVTGEGAPVRVIDYGKAGKLLSY